MFAIVSNVYVNVLRAGISDWPNAGKSGTTRCIRSSRAGMSSRNMWPAVGKPCNSRTGPARRGCLLERSSTPVHVLHVSRVMNQQRTTADRLTTYSDAVFAIFVSDMNRGGPQR